MMGVLQQPSVIGAIIGVFGTLVVTAIIAPLVKKRYFDSRNRVSFEIRIWNYKTSNVLKQLADNDSKSRWKLGERDYKSIEQMTNIAKCNCYIEATITNVSTKKITGVTVTMADTLLGDYVQIDEADAIVEVKAGEPISVGDIQPRHSRTAHIWTFSKRTDHAFSTVRKLLRISADEIDAVRLKFPLPPYLKDMYGRRVFIGVTIIGLLLLAVEWSYIGLIK